MQYENMMTFVRAIKGAPASILWALMITQRMMTALELQTWTGYKGDNITTSVRLLEELGWVVARSSRGPWGLAEGRQLPLMAGIEQIARGENPDSDLIGVDGLIVVNVESEESHKFRATLTTNKKLTPIKSESAEKILSVKTINKDLSDVDECLAVLKAGGIYGKKADQIAEDWHITVDDIRAQFAWVRTEEWQNANGMVIYRLLNHVIPPPLQENGHIVDCKCRECQVEKFSKRYSESAFGSELNGSNNIDEDDEEQ